MINAFKQIRLTNVNISGQNGRIAVANSGNLAFTSELQAVESSLNTTINNLSGSLASTIEGNNSSFLAASGVLDSRITSEVSTLNGTISSASGSLDSRITSEVSTLNSSLLAASGDLKSYVNNQISGVIDMAPEALNTLNELAAALGDDASFATNLTNTLTNISGSLNSAIDSAENTLNSGIAATGSNLQGQIDNLASTYVTLNTTQTISGDKTFAGNTSFAGGFEVNASQQGDAALFVSGNYVGINTEAPTEALDVNGNAKVAGSLFVGSGINANNKVISNVAAPVNSTDAVNKTYVDSASGDLSTRLVSSGAALDSRITSEVSSLNSSLSTASGALDSRITSEVSALNSSISTASGALNSSLVAVSGDLKSYVNSQISGVIDMAPEALNTLNELAAALGDDSSFATNLTNTLTNISGSLDSRITSEVSALNSTISTASGALNSSLSSVSGVLQSAIDTKVASATQKQFAVLLPVGVESTGISFPGNVFGSTPSVQVTMEGDVIYQSLIKNRTVSGFDIYFSDSIQEENVYLNVFASNQ
jgi:hypothetical protein